MSEAQRPTQLTIDGGEVTHPPPRPKGRCPECEKLITITDGQYFYQHNIYPGELCPMSGIRYQR